MSFLKRIHADAVNACQDVYSNWVLGDDAGKSARLTLVLRPTSLPMKKSSRHPSTHARLDLGMTFLEINGRAYVNSVTPNSPAALAGILPQDAVQWAMVCDPELVDDDGVKMEQQVLEMEKAGKRISYKDLRNMLAQAMDPTQAAFLSPSPQQRSNYWTGPPIPSTVNVCVPVPSGDDGHELYSGEAPKPVVFCFRRTRQRQVQTISPAFRIDDECDLATSLVRRLAPTADMETPLPDTWEELVHDGTDWLLGRGSMLPPQAGADAGAGKGNGVNGDGVDANGSIPLDDLELERSRKLAALRSRITAESMVDKTDDVEAVTIRGMIQKAVGLAFVRASKVVVGVSVHGGSGIVLARLSDGTWSAPSAIGTWGLGLGIQFGLEVAEYIFILQTQEALDHFKRGGSFTVGGNIGAAFAGLGREAYGAASVGGGCGNPNAIIKDDEYNDTDTTDRNKVHSSLAVAPIVAYAKSQGLYLGVSLEGSRIFSRDDINGRTYKFSAGRDVNANDILSGKVPTPPEAEELYAALHSVEFTHEMSCLPRPPEVLRADSANGWLYNHDSLIENVASPPQTKSSRKSMRFLDALSPKEAEECEAFETQFKNFLYGGVSVQRLLPGTRSRTGRTAKERRTLWLMLPETGSLCLGFVSKLSDGEGGVGGIQQLSNERSTQMSRREDPSRLSGLEGDIGTVGSEELTLDSALHTKDGGSTIGHIRTGNVQLSHKHSVALTDVTALSQEPKAKISFKEEEQMERLRVISIQDVSGTSLLFLANNFREAELLVCGLKLLIEREAARLGVRGGLPMTSVGGQRNPNAVSPQAARGFRELPVSRPRKDGKSRKSSGHSSSDVGEDATVEASVDIESRVADRRSWGSVPGRNYMRGQAAALTEANARSRQESERQGKRELLEQGVPKYVHGQSLVKEIETNIRLPLPFPLSRVLLLDSTSPVVTKWEKERGDQYFEKSNWAFPPSSPRGLERHSSEHQLISSGSMEGAHRTISFDRPRYGSLVRLSETHHVDLDDSKKLTFTIHEHNPRRGFSLQIRILLRAHREVATDASILADIRPVGKDMSNQAAVHKAFLLVLDEVKVRYGLTPGGFLCGLREVVDDMGNDQRGDSVPSPFEKTAPNSEEKKVDSLPTRKNPKNESGLVSFEDMLKSGRQRTSPETVPNVNHERPSTPSLMHQIPDPDPSKRLPPPTLPEDELLMTPTKEAAIEVKPLPKIRLSLMPSPREEDEDRSSGSPMPSKLIRKKKKSKSRRRSSSSYRSST